MLSINLYEFNDTTALIRLAMALIASAILGMERTRKLRPAGMRTYMLVCIGACSTMLGGIYLYETFGPGFDPARMAAQVISGIGFIGAGTIIVAHQKVRGLTTAAGLWAVACLGINIGVGNYVIALGVFTAMLITMFLADKLEIIFFRHLRRIHVSVLIRSIESIPNIREAMKELDITLTNMEFAKVSETNALSLTCFLRMKHRTPHQTAIEKLESAPGVLHVDVLDI